MHWPALDDLPRGGGLIWSGSDRGLVAALAGRPIIGDLTWRAAPAEVDLRRTHLTRLRLADSAVDRLRLPAGVNYLELSETRVGSVDGDHKSRSVRVSITSGSPVVIPPGLRELRDLHLIGAGTIDVAPLAGLTELSRLLLYWRDAPGELIGADALGGLPRLAELILTDGYGLRADTLPEMPALTRLTVHGLRRTVATAIKARYRHTGVHVTVTGAKDDTWLAANLSNPFRDWADDDARAGAAACKAYAAAVRAIDKAPDAAAGAETILHKLVEELNRVDARYENIDTVRREEAGDAFLALATRAGVPTDRADQWFDDWRDF